MQADIENGMLMFQESKAERKVFSRCVCCESAIYYGDEYFDLDGDNICEDCIEKSRREATAI